MNPSVRVNHWLLMGDDSVILRAMNTERSNNDPATTHDTVDAIANSTQRGAFPLRRTFIQQKQGRDSLPGPLAAFVAAGDRTALLLYFLALTKASQPPWDVSLHSAVWARAVGLRDPISATARGRISKTWTRLVDRRLVTRARRNRLAAFTLLCEDGSGVEYSRPNTSYINVPHELWTAGPSPSSRWFETLTLPELTFLIIGLSNLDQFPLPIERGPDYYGISADTLQRGSSGLRRRELLSVQRRLITAPLAPQGVSWENRYTLRPPFGPRGKISTAVSSSR